MQGKVIANPINVLDLLMILFTVSVLFGCANTSNLSMESIGEVNIPIKKVLIASRTNMSLKYREQHHGTFVSVVKAVLDKHDVEWIYSDNPRVIFNAHKKKKLSHSLLISTRQQRYSSMGSHRSLEGYTLTLALSDLRQRHKVWEGELINSDVKKLGENDKAKMKKLVTEHFIQAGIIYAPLHTANTTE